MIEVFECVNGVANGEERIWERVQRRRKKGLL